MLTRLTPGSGNMPALRPTCPGIHWPFCCATTAELASSTQHTMNTKVVRRANKHSDVNCNPHNSCCNRQPFTVLELVAGLMFGYSRTLFSYAAMISSVGPYTH